MRHVPSALVLLAALPVLAGFLGRLHPAGDSFAVFRLPLAGALALAAVLCILSGARRLGGAGLALAALAAALPLWAMLAPGPVGGDLRVYQKNLLFRNDDLPGLMADIRATDPDVITLQEVSAANETLLSGLRDGWPHQLLCPFARVGGTAVLTRLPPIPGRTICAPGLSAVEVTGPQGPLWLVSVHLHWPWPYRQAAHLKELLALVETMEGPVVMAGDFNMVAWSDALAALRWAAGVDHARPSRGTYIGFDPWLRLPIDHVLAPGGGRMETRPALGSDHLGLLAEVRLAAPGG